MAALVGPEGILLVDAQSPAVTDTIVAALKGISPAPLRFLVNTHVHADHTGGNENFAKLGVTILGRPNLLEQLVHPVPGNQRTSARSFAGGSATDHPFRQTVKDRVRQAIREGKTLDQVHDAKLTADFEARVGGLPAFINVFVDALYKELKAGAR